MTHKPGPCLDGLGHVQGHALVMILLTGQSRPEAQHGLGQMGLNQSLFNAHLKMLADRELMRLLRCTSNRPLNQLGPVPLLSKQSGVT